MIKHESTVKNSAVGAKPVSGVAGTGMISYDAKRVATEKNTMRRLDEKAETDIHSHDVVPYETTTEVKAFRQKTGTGVPANGVQVNAQTVPQTDVEKNIVEAERYINSITTQNARKVVTESVRETQKPIPSTVEINAFAPKISFRENSPLDSAVSASHTNSSEDTAQTQAFRLNNPSHEPTKPFATVKTSAEQTKAFSAVGGITGQVTGFDTGGAITEQTRAFHIGSAITEQTRTFGVNSATTKQTISFDGPSDRISEFQETADLTNSGEARRSAASKKKHKEAESAPRFEYTSTLQNQKIEDGMYKLYKRARIRLFLSSFFVIVLFLIENIAPVKAIFPSNFLYIAVDWILAFVCFFLVWDRMADTFKSFFKGKPQVACITVFSFLFSLAATAVALVFEKAETAIVLYNFPFAVCVFLDLLFVYYQRCRDIYSFSVLSSSNDKCAIVLSDSEQSSSSEQETDEEHVENAGFGEVKRMDFIEGYFAHASEAPNVQAPLKIFIPLCLLVSIAFFACALWIMKYSVPESLGIAYATFMMCTPLSAFMAYCYPLYLAARRVQTYNSAILCDKTPDMYKDSSTVVFRDTEAIPAGKAKVKSIRLYGDKKIDNAIYYASSVYSVIGGPLEDVFRNAALNSVSSENVQIREISAEGVCAMVDGKNIVIGRPAYMEEQCFETMPEPGDDEYDGKTNKRIFYLACEQFIIAKFYIQYSISADFLYIADRLFSSGIGISVKTADPCLDDGIFYENKIDPEQHAIRIDRGCLQDGDEESVPAKRAGVVSVGDVKDLIKAFLVCKKLETVRRTNLVLHVVSSVLAVAVMALIVFTGNTAGLHSLYPALYQLFWILPTYFVSKVYL